MKLPDVSVLIAAGNTDSLEHEVVRRWLESAFDAPASVALALAAMLGFIRIATRPGLLPRPLRVEDALLVVRDWIEAPRARIVQPTPGHGPLLARLLLAAGTAGNLTSDAHLAALAMEHGATLGSFDRFEGLRFEWLRA